VVLLYCGQEDLLQVSGLYRVVSITSILVNSFVILNYKNKNMYLPSVIKLLFTSKHSLNTSLLREDISESFEDIDSNVNFHGKESRHIRDSSDRSTKQSVKLIQQW
jgi:hypothetical protein